MLVFALEKSNVLKLPRVAALLSAFDTPLTAQILSYLLHLSLCLIGAFSIAPMARAQVAPTATRGNNMQVGGEFSLASPDYGPDRLRGFGAYATYDFHWHLGVEGDFRQLLDPNSKIAISERTYEIGPRYSQHFGPLQPYAKFLVGRGVFQFPPDPLHPANGPVANLAYTLWAGGFGADYRIRPHINLRADYEFQNWNGFPPNGLTPRVFSVGAAFHFR